MSGTGPDPALVPDRDDDVPEVDEAEPADADGDDYDGVAVGGI